MKVLNIKYFSGCQFSESQIYICKHLKLFYNCIILSIFWFILDFSFVLLCQLTLKIYICPKTFNGGWHVWTFVNKTLLTYFLEITTHVSQLLFVSKYTLLYSTWSIQVDWRWPWTFRLLWKFIHDLLTSTNRKETFLQDSERKSSNF